MLIFLLITYSLNNFKSSSTYQHRLTIRIERFYVSGKKLEYAKKLFSFVNL